MNRLFTRFFFTREARIERVFLLPSWERARVTGLCGTWSPSPHSSPVEGEDVGHLTAVERYTNVPLLFRVLADDSPRRYHNQKRFGLNLVIVTAIFATVLSGCGKKAAPLSESEVRAVVEKTLPSTAEDKIWERVPLHSAKLLLQDMVEPRQMQASTGFVHVQAITDGQKLVFRLSWKDATVDDLPGPGRFGDAVAVQLPAATTADVPAPQMGEEGKSVEITHWSAVWQAVVNGRKDDIQAIYPRAKVDHYPFEAASLKPGSPAQQEMEKRYAPARSLGNPMAGPRTVPVQDLVAEGPGTLRPADKALSSGTGKYDKDGWTVLLFRPLPKGAQLGGRTQVAFAVWEGSHQEVGARKMRTAWIPLALGSAQ